MRKANATILLVAAMCVAAGCQKLSYSKTLKLGPGNVEDIATFDPPVYDQRVTVTVEPTSAAVSAYLVKEADSLPAARRLRNKQEPDAAAVLGSRVSVGAPQAYTFEASVPAKVGYTLLLKGGSQATDVKVTLVGR